MSSTHPCPLSQFPFCRNARCEIRYTEHALMARIVVCPTTNGPVAVVIDGVSVEDIVGGDPFMLAYRVLTGANHYTDRKCVPR